MALVEKIFKKKLLVILYENPETNGGKIHLAEYTIDDETFIPVFTSEEAMEKATEDIDMDLPVWEIDGALLASMFEPEDLVVVNPGLKDQEEFSGAEIISVMKEYFPENKQPEA